MTGLAGSSVLKSLPASAGDMGSIPDPAGSHMSQSNLARAPQPLTLYSRQSPGDAITKAHALKLLKSTHPRDHDPKQKKLCGEKPANAIKDQPLLSANRESPHINEDPTWPKINE